MNKTININKYPNLTTREQAIIVTRMMGAV
jgi:hypothetical protein